MPILSRYSKEEIRFNRGGLQKRIIDIRPV